MADIEVEGERCFVVTGATSGLGLALTRRLVRLPGVRVVAPARDLARAAALKLGERVTWVELDLRSLAAVRAFAAGWRGRIDGLVNNAGVSAGALRRTGDGWEETVAVNHLAALQLTVGLLPHLVGGRVVFLGSSTHNPEYRRAQRFAHRGPRFTSIEALARGSEEAGASPARLGFDRYATSKLLNTVTAIELGRRIAGERVAVYGFDPWMMPGTGLQRAMPLPVRFLWATVLRMAVPWMAHASTPERSAVGLEWLLTVRPPPPSGQIFGVDRLPSRTVWTGAQEPALGRAVVDESLALLGATLA
ncbi:SDR family NAD(P)-dependent oxidoreductase [Nannocystis radixulma]|uniref:SDR family NAD(P)-dependent oxidoreductase n=1 Tax=Nannocystis radixulma TaxID=2995305 RepID=A0ABT5B5N2_9BACT|nr:SDR family NAD(P)-dependent oxidoreductase [Nannocystis radixulma]MDC0669429.1 SDR family NAD(P)-dependent oxidoreductase [Nannocystis radixulma]